MKLSGFAPVFVLTGLLGLVACERAADPSSSSSPSSSAASSASPIDRFKQEMLGVKSWVESKDAEMKASAASDPTAAMGLLKELTAKLRAVKTDDLPTDLKDAYARALASLSGMSDLFEGMPEKAEERTAFLMKLGSDPAFQTKAGELGKEMEDSFNNLKEVAKKHGIEDLDLEPKN